MISGILKLRNKPLGAFGANDRAGTPIPIKTPTGASYTLAAAAGTFTVTGVAAGLRAQRTISAALGTFALAGNAARLAYGRSLVAGLGTFVLAGQATGLRAARLLPAGAGVFNFAGLALQLRVARLISPGVGTFVVNGAPATLIPPVTVPVTQPSVGGGVPSRRRLVPRFDYEPVPRRHRVLQASAGTFALTGAAVQFHRGESLVRTRRRRAIALLITQ